MVLLYLLFNKEKLIKAPNYHEVELHNTEEKFVFCSLISWQPSNVEAIWSDYERSTSNKRLRKLEISNYTRSAYPKIENTIDNVPYSLDINEKINIYFDKRINGFIKGNFPRKIIYYK